MTNEELLTDLKQFIETAVSQQVDDVKSEIKTVRDEVRLLDSKIDKLDEKTDTMDEKLDAIQDAIGETAQDHEQRLRRLEKRTA